MFEPALVLIASAIYLVMRDMHREEAAPAAASVGSDARLAPLAQQVPYSADSPWNTPIAADAQPDQLSGKMIGSLNMTSTPANLSSGSSMSGTTADVTRLTAHVAELTEARIIVGNSSAS